MLNSGIEYGVVLHGIVDTTDQIDFNVTFTKAHSTPPKTILLSYEMWGYFYGELHVRRDYTTKTGFSAIFLPKEIGNKTSPLALYWIALW